MATEAEKKRLKKGTRLLALWTGLLAAPIAWGAHMQVNYSLVPWVCTNGKEFLLHLVTIITLIICAIGGYAAWRSWQEAGIEWPGELGGVEKDELISRTRFMAALGLLTSAMFFLTIIAQEIPTYYFHPCQR